MNRANRQVPRDGLRQIFEKTLKISPLAKPVPRAPAIVI
jgi:hypothetical protein